MENRAEKEKPLIENPEVITGEHFLDIDDEMLTFLERHGEECIKGINESTNINKENAYKLLSILIVGIGSSFVFLTQNKPPMFLAVGLVTFVAYWSVCAMVLVKKVLSVRERVLISASPYDLYHKDWKGFNDKDYEYFESHGFSAERTTLGILRRYRLREMTDIAKLHQIENARISKELERVRIYTILTPVIALSLSGFAYLFV
ncbi:UNVERIFIED_ORG: energy-converting hydrogenase Eha subunit E [Lelliottia amnigena]|jgi:energy-converting hydrogenase Eha subunit E|nr:energy-converting hydrogenase Eha subunit E [Lelliottia amnigena]